MIEHRIKVSREEFQLLSSTFKVSGVTVWKALNYKSNNDLAVSIRELALRRGGIEITTLPACMDLEAGVSYFHDTDGVLRQRLKNGTMIELDKTDGTGVVYQKGKKVQTFYDVKISSIGALQKYALLL